jgi:hypothetical protein
MLILSLVVEVRPNGLHARAVGEGLARAEHRHRTTSSAAPSDCIYGRAATQLSTPWYLGALVLELPVAIFKSQQLPTLVCTGVCDCPSIFLNKIAAVVFL